MEGVDLNRSFWCGRRVLVTGHTGFKGAWLALWLEAGGAHVTGLALPPDTEPSLFRCLADGSGVRSTMGDVRDPQVAVDVLAAAQPEVVFHLAAQALVRASFAEPAATFATNVMGTVHLLEAIRHAPTVQAVVVVTSDKVYENDGTGRPFREDDRLGGRDPYSASKACQELVASSYRHTFLGDAPVRLGRARAGNVIGGGDWGRDRLVADFVRAVSRGEIVRIRRPDATRPWQHVLDALSGYLLYAEQLCGDADVPEVLNFGPEAQTAQPVRHVADRLAQLWGEGSRWIVDAGDSIPEERSLTLDASLAVRRLGFRPRLTLDEALAWTVDWYRAFYAGRDMRRSSLEQIRRYEDLPA
jgi:CDP-glucose 4,6-dehydratase